MLRSFCTHHDDDQIEHIPFKAPFFYHIEDKLIRQTRKKWQGTPA